MLTVDIDSNSGFCAGVIRAIGKAEDFLAQNDRLYSLGAIVHNDAELSRLTEMGLVTIDKEDLGEMVNAAGETLLIRAHGEPPQTYTLADELGFKLIDCTCPVVLQLQRKIKEAYQLCKDGEGRGQIIIFGKTGHAEVLGLVGQTEGTAIVVENSFMLEDLIEKGTIKLDAPTMIFSQTTKSPAEYAHVCARLLERMAKFNNMRVESFKATGMIVINDTICSQVASRHSMLTKFALQHDIIIFVSGKASSNGKVLCDLCKSLNIRTYHITSPSEIKRDWFRADDIVGVCGATSTPKWLLEKVAEDILELNKYVADWEKIYGEKGADNQ